MTERDPLISGLYREADHPEPPAALDARIRAEAVRDLSGQAGGRRSLWRRLSAPLAFAAVAVLAVAVSLLAERERAHETVSPEPAKHAVPAPTGAPPPAPPESPPEPPEPATARPVPAMPAPAGSKPARAPAPPAPEARTEREAPLTEDSQAARDLAKEAKPAPPSASSEAPAAAGVAVPVPAESRRAQETAPTLRGKADADQPAAWIERIRALLREGRADEAHALVARFRERFPGHPLPEDLGPGLRRVE